VVLLLATPSATETARKVMNADSRMTPLAAVTAAKERVVKEREERREELRSLLKSIGTRGFSSLAGRKMRW